MDAKELAKAERGVAATTDKVFMLPQVYASKRVQKQSENPAKH
jgi:hypothetical protein